MNYKETAIHMLKNNEDERLDGLVYHFMKEILGEKGGIFEMQECIIDMVRKIQDLKHLNQIYSSVELKFSKERVKEENQ